MRIVMQPALLAMAALGSPLTSKRTAAVMLQQADGPYPALCVFDLDACLWDKEMFEMPAVPTAEDVVVSDLAGRGDGVVAVMSGRHRISLHAGALLALQEVRARLLPFTQWR